MNVEQSQVLSRFCDRVLAVNGETGEAFEGRVQVKAGPKLSRAKNTLDSISISPEISPPDLVKKLTRQVEILAQDGEHPRLYLVAYRTGSTSPFESERLDFDPAEHGGADIEPANIDWNNGSAALFGALGVGYERMTRQIMTQNGELHALTMHLVDKITDLQIQVVRAEHMAMDANGAQMAAVLSEITERALPLLAQVGPGVAASVIAYWQARASREAAEAAKATGQDGPPTEPHAAMAHHVRTLQGTLMQIAALSNSNPETMTDGVRANLTQTMSMANAAAARWAASSTEGEPTAA